MNARIKFLAQAALAAAAAAALAAYAFREPLGAFLQTNRAEYLANLGQWNDSLARIEKLGPAGEGSRRAARLAAEAHLHLGDPFKAIEAWQRYSARAPQGEGSAEEPILAYGLALLATGQEAAALEDFSRGADPFAAAMARFLKEPSNRTFNELQSVALEGYSDRWLYVALAQAAGARVTADSGDIEGALRMLRPHVERFPAHPIFKFEYGLASLKNAGLDLAASYLIAGLDQLGRFGEAPAAAELAGKWRAAIVGSVVALIYSGRLEQAVHFMRMAGERLALDLARPAAIAANIDRLSASEAFELAALRRERPELFGGPQSAPGGPAEYAEWLGWFAAQGSPLPLSGFPAGVAAVSRILPDPAPVLSVGAERWGRRMAAPAPEVGERMLLLRLSAESRRGVGAGAVLSLGWESRRLYSGDREKWYAFGLPLTVGESVPANLRLSNADLPGVDLSGPRREERRLHLKDALLVEFARRTPIE